MASAKEKSVYNSFIKKHPQIGLPKTVEKFKSLFHTQVKFDKDTFAFDLTDSMFQAFGMRNEWLFFRIWPREDPFLVQEYNFLKPRRDKLVKLYAKSRAMHLLLVEGYEKAKKVNDEKLMVPNLKEAYAFLMKELIPEFEDAARIVKEGWIQKSKQSNRQEENIGDVHSP